MVQPQSSVSTSCRGQAGHQLPGAAPVLLQGLGVALSVTAARHYVDLHTECDYQHQSSILSFVQWSWQSW